MFGIFIDNIFYNMWANKKTDIWYQLTVPKINPQNKSIKCYWYEIISVPEYFGFDENKNLQIKEKIINEETQEISYNVIQTINKEMGEWL